MALTKKQGTFLIGISVVVVILLSLTTQNVPIKLSDGKMFWQVQYESSAQSSLLSYSTDIANTDYYDYNDKQISQIASQIASGSATTKDAIKSTLRHVFQNIDYVSEGDTNCFDGTAPKILDSGKGQCDTQSIVVISILRKMGIAARPVGGCVYSNPNCILQSMFQSTFQQFSLAPKYDETIIEEDQNIFSRTQSLSREGGLHAWVAVWIPEEGWIHLEPTTGRFADLDCNVYHVELYPENNQKRDICVSKNRAYASACRVNDLQILNKEGKGLAQDVNP